MPPPRSTPPLLTAALAWLSVMLLGVIGPLEANPALLVEIARVPLPPVIDGHLQDWGQSRWISFAEDTSDNPWVAGSRLRDDGPTEKPLTAQTALDLSGSFALAWDDEWIYLAARVTDNVHDVEGGEPGQWYLRDSVSLFLDLPLDGDGFGWIRGDHGFSFVADPSDPRGGRWWRRGGKAGRRETAAPEQVQMAVRLTAEGYDLEAAIPMAVLARTTPEWRPPFEGRTVGFMFLVTDPDGGPDSFGGQLSYGGTSDDDGLWSKLRFRPAGMGAPPQILDPSVRVNVDAVEPTPEERQFESRVKAGQAATMSLLLAASDSSKRSELVASHRLLADECFQIYLDKRPSRLAVKAVGLAFSLWGESASVDQIRQALSRISFREDVWHLILPGLRQAFYLAGNTQEAMGLVEQLQTQVTPLRSRSALLLPLANHWLWQGHVERARKAYEQIVFWKASLWHIEGALRGLNRIVALEAESPPAPQP